MIMNGEHQRPLRVLHIVDTLGVGGAETWLIQLLRHWAGTKGVEADILLTSGRAGVFDDEAASLGAQLFYVRYGRSDLVGFAGSYRKILQQDDYNAVHDHQDYTSGWRWLLSYGLRPPIRVSHVHNPIMHYHSNYSISFSRRCTAAVGRFLMARLATHVCGTSAQLLGEYGFEPGARQKPTVSAVHCGIDVARFNGDAAAARSSLRGEFGWPESSQIILFAGRLDRAMEFDHPQNHKNSWFALHAAKAAASRDQTVRLLMAGGGDEMRAQLESVIAEWGLSNRFRLVGVRHDMPRLMRGSDVLLFPSRQEGLGMVAVEAQAAGLPVLASTAVPRECVVLPELCEFLPLAEGPSAWGETLLRAMERPHLPMMRCRKAFVGSPFSIEESAASLERIYRGES